MHVIFQAEGEVITSLTELSKGWIHVIRLDDSMSLKTTLTSYDERHERSDSTGPSPRVETSLQNPNSPVQIVLLDFHATVSNTQEPQTIGTGSQNLDFHFLRNEYHRAYMPRNSNGSSHALCFLDIDVHAIVSPEKGYDY